jgi:hypothetical protein
MNIFDEFPLGVILRLIPKDFARLGQGAEHPRIVPDEEPMQVSRSVAIPLCRVSTSQVQNSLHG